MEKIENGELNFSMFFWYCLKTALKEIEENIRLFEVAKGKRPILKIPHAVLKSAKQENIKRFIVTTTNSLCKLIFLPDGKIYGKNLPFLGLAIRQ